MNDLQTLNDAIIVWQRETFPTATISSTILHLASEIGECISAAAPGIQDILAYEARQKLLAGSLKNSNAIESEIADVFILLVQLADTAGVNLAQVVEKKMLENAARKWKSPDSTGVIEHANATTSED